MFCTTCIKAVVTAVVNYLVLMIWCMDWDSIDKTKSLIRLTKINEEEETVGFHISVLLRIANK